MGPLRIVSDHQLLVTLNIIRSVILIASIICLCVYTRVDRRIVIVVAAVLLILNLCGLAIATFLVNHA